MRVRVIAALERLAPAGTTYREGLEKEIDLGSRLVGRLRALRDDVEDDYTRRVEELKAESVNADLAKHAVYNKLDQKNITAWLDLRNKAAHGQYDQYDSEQVGGLIREVRGFLTRNPA